MIVEDETSFAQTNTYLLQEHGFHVLTAFNGAEAVDIALKSPTLDLILMDIDLGAEMDGAEIAQQILQQRDLPLLFLSGHTEASIVAKTANIASYGYVDKGSGAVVLLASINMAFKLFDAHQRLKHQEEVLRTHQVELELANEELRATEVQLKASAQKYMDLYDFAPVGYCTLDAEGRILEANLTAARLFGVARGNLLQTRLYHYLVEPDRDRFYLHLRALAHATTQQTCELRLLRPDGAEGWVQLETMSFAARQYRTAISDITERKRAEEALREDERQLRELNALNAQKDKFVSILAHDLKNPLVSFLCFAKLLEEDFEGMAPAERAHLIQLFRESAEALFALLENLLTWSQLQRGMMAYFPQALILDWMAARDVALFAPQAAQKQITLTQAVPAIGIQGDYNMVDAVIRNLISNAIKFTPPGGAVQMTATLAAQEVRIAVADTGIGISPEKVAQLFQIDAKTQRPGTAGEKGTGLGLILCKEFVEKHGGRLWVESVVGQGTTVTFTLPATPAPC